MFQKKNKDWVIKMTAGFFAAMVVLTMVSRAIYQHGIVAVTTEKPTPGSVAHNIFASGKVIQNQDLAVTTVGGLRVASVQVNAGQQVSTGALLFTLDMDYLAETILRQQQDMKKQKLSIQDAWSMANASQKQRENQKAQAQENYDSAVSKAQTICDRAERDLERAQKALEDFRNGTDSDQAEEQLLIAACAEAQKNVDSAKSELQSLQNEILAEIERRIQAAQQETQPTVPETTEPIVPEPIPAPTEETSGQAETQAENPEVSQPEATNASDSAEEQIPSRPSAILCFSAGELSPAEKEQIAAAVRAEYAPRIAAGEDNVRDAEFALKLAQEELEKYQKDQHTVKSEAELIAAVEQAQEAYDDAVTALEDAEINGNRGIQSADLPSAVSNAGAIGQITYEQMELVLQKLKDIQAAEGKICSPADGIITEVHVKTGELTSDTTAVLMVDLSKGCKFTCQVTKEDSKYIGVGDKVTLKPSGNGKQYQNLPVTTFSQSKEDENVYDLTVQLPEKTLRYGASADLSFTKKSRGYDCCVPLSALHMDARNIPYVLVAVETESILGKEMEAKKVSVKILEQNHMLAALEPGSLGGRDLVIVGAERFVDAGSRIRVK